MLRQGIGGQDVDYHLTPDRLVIFRDNIDVSNDSGLKKIDKFLSLFEIKASSLDSFRIYCAIVLPLAFVSLLFYPVFSIAQNFMEILKKIVLRKMVKKGKKTT